MENGGERLDSWKEIADYLKRDVRTVQRWESSEQLPVHRLLHKKRPTVYAFKEELDVWIQEKEPTLGNNGEPWYSYLWYRISTSYLCVMLFGVFTGSVLMLLVYQFLWEAIPDLPSYNVVPLTAYEGSEDQAALSPGGDQIVFSWDGCNGNQYDLFVEQIKMGSRIQLTDTPEREYSPAWSNDGSVIAFLKWLSNDRSEILLVTPLGGTPKKIGEVASPEFLWGRQLSWSKEGDWLITTDREPGSYSYLVLISPNTGERRQLTSPPAGYWGDHSAAFSRDGSSIVFVRSLGEWVSDLYLLPLSEKLMPEGEPKRLTFKKTFCLDPVWLGNDQEILFSAGTWPEMKFFELDIPTLKVTERLHITGEGVSSASYSPVRKRLVFTRSKPEVNIWEKKLTNSDTENAEPVPLIVSSRLDWRPEYSRQGDRILFSSQRSGAEELWAFGKNNIETGPITRFWATHCGHASWSPDDKLVAFHTCIEGSCDIYVKDAQICMSEGPTCEEEPCCLRQMTSSAFDDFDPSWSRDGEWIYFTSLRSGESEIWKVSLEGGEPVQVTTVGGFYALESEDGKTLFYSKKGIPGIWRQGLEGDEMEELIVDGAFNHFALNGQNLYYVMYSPAFDHHFDIRRRNLATGDDLAIAEVNERFAWSFAVAPDSSAVSWSQFDTDRADLMLIENF